jgi:hypothetical protein
VHEPPGQSSVQATTDVSPIKSPTSRSGGIQPQPTKAPELELDDELLDELELSDELLEEDDGLELLELGELELELELELLEELEELEELELDELEELEELDELDEEEEDDDPGQQQIPSAPISCLADLKS